MSVVYDIAKLEEFSDFDVKGALKNYPFEQEYFDELTRFTEECEGYLRSYNPTVVIYGDDVRREFLSEIAGLMRALEPLKFTAVLDRLNNILDAIESANEKSLLDALWVLFATMEITAKNIISARIEGSAITNTAASLYEQKEKPLVLAVDDSPIVLTSIKESLKEDCAVICVDSAAAALRLLENHSPDIFLFDIVMPEMDGFELAEKVMANGRFRDSIMIFLTGVTTKEHVLTAKSMGVSDFIAKPVDKEVVLKKIRTQLAARG